RRDVPRRRRADRGLRHARVSAPSGKAHHHLRRPEAAPCGVLGRADSATVGASCVLARHAFSLAGGGGASPEGAPLKTSAEVVVIGGGVGGCSILYWLTRLGRRDVVLVERAELTSGSTFHSAGLVGQLRGSLSLTRMMMSSVELYRTLGEEVGLETGWREV